MKLARLRRRIEVLLRDPDMRSAIAYLAIRPHRWSYRRRQVVSRKPPYLADLTAANIAPVDFQPLLEWGDAPIARQTFDLRLASRMLPGVAFGAIPWRTHFDDLEDEASLHRFAWLLPWLLDRHSERCNRADVLRFLRAAQADWIRSHRSPESIEAWQSYTVSERLMNWIIAAFAVGEPPGDAMSSIREQAKYLLDHLEYFGEELTGNHLSNNGRALYSAGLLLGDSNYIAAGRTILLEEPRRLFEQGGFLREDSTHYQFLITRRYEEMLWLARHCGDRETFTALEPIVRRLNAACSFFLVRSGDGWTIPLIGDLSPDSSPAWLIGPCGWRQLFRLNEDEKVPVARQVDGEWARLDRERWTVFAHVNRNGVPFQPGHAHNDTGGIVAFFDGKPVVLDSGRRHYVDDEVGRYGRSSAAHSTLLVDGRDAAPEPAWFIPSDFLVVRTGARPRLAVEEDSLLITHGGFSRLTGVGNTSRRVAVENMHLTISDEVRGTGRHRVSVVLHLNDELPLQISVPNDLKVTSEWRGPLDEDCRGWAAARYGAKSPIRTIFAEGEVQLPWQGSTVCAVS